jgi:hypothetical protein
LRSFAPPDEADDRNLLESRLRSGCRSVAPPDPAGADTQARRQQARAKRAHSCEPEKRSGASKERGEQKKEPTDEAAAPCPVGSYERENGLRPTVPSRGIVIGRAGRAVEPHPSEPIE